MTPLPAAESSPRARASTRLRISSTRRSRWAWARRVASCRRSRHTCFRKLTVGITGAPRQHCQRQRRQDDRSGPNSSAIGRPSRHPEWSTHPVNFPFLIVVQKPGRESPEWCNSCSRLVQDWFKTGSNWVGAIARDTKPCLEGVRPTYPAWSSVAERTASRFRRRRSGR